MDDNKENKKNIDNNKDNLNKDNIIDESEPKPLGKQVSIVHYYENSHINKVIESPRSIYAMNSLGWTMNDIYYLTFPEFLEKYPEFRRFPVIYQKYFYSLYEDFRLSKIQCIKIKRDDIIKNNININDNINITEEQMMPTFSSSIKKEIMKFEQIKKKNEQDLIKAIEYELERHILLKEEESKIRKSNMKKEKFQKELEIKRYKEKKELENREHRKYLQEKERLKKLDEENKKKYKIAQEYEKKEELKKKEKLKEKEKKQKELEIKRINFEKKVEKMNNDFNNKILQKMYNMEERDIKRKENNEIKKQELIEKNKEKKRIKEEKISKIKIKYQKN